MLKYRISLEITETSQIRLTEQPDRKKSTPNNGILDLWNWNLRVDEVGKQKIHGRS